MGCSLIAHNKGYELSPTDYLFSLATGFAGASFAQRHFDLALTGPKEQRIAHRVLGIVFCIPLLGALAALIELFVIHFFFHKPEAPIEKLLLNAEVALTEHHLKALDMYGKSKTYLYDDALPILTDLHKPQALQLSHTAAEYQGPCEAMEDAHFYLPLEEGVLAAVFDGHGGRAVADYACRIFKERFATRLRYNHPTGAIQQLFNEIQKEIKMNHPEWGYTGTTAVVCYIEAKTGLVFTATLGDSEANIYRKVKSGWRSMPLSIVSDWTRSQELQRAGAIHRPQEWSKEYNSKSLRFPDCSGLNISRSLGDTILRGTAIIHEGEMTINKLLPGDILLLSCDGLKDYVPEHEITQQIIAACDQPLADYLARYAIFHNKAEDNVTVIAIKVQSITRAGPINPY